MKILGKEETDDGHSFVASLIVVAYHKPGHLQRLLQPLERHDDLELVVVNVEGDSEISEIAAGNNAIEVVAEYNGGYAYAVNLGARAASGATIIYCNDDLTISYESIKTLSEVIESGLAEVVVPLVVDIVGIPQRTILPLPTLHNFIKEWVLLPDWPITRLGFLNVQKWRLPTHYEKIVAATGAVVAVNHDLFREVPLPEQYFMYWEEVDWFWQLHLRDAAVGYLPEAVVVHYGGRDDLRPEKSALITRNALRCLKATQGFMRASVAYPFVVLWALRLLAFDFTKSLLRNGRDELRLTSRRSALAAALISWRELR